MQNNYWYSPKGIVESLEHCKYFTHVSKEDNDIFDISQRKKYQKYLDNKQNYLWVNDSNGKTASPAVSQAYAKNCLKCKRWFNCRRIMGLYENIE